MCELFLSLLSYSEVSLSVKVVSCRTFQRFSSSRRASFVVQPNHTPSPPRVLQQLLPAKYVVCVCVCVCV